MNDRNVLAVITRTSVYPTTRATIKFSKVFDTELPEDTIHILVYRPPLDQHSTADTAVLPCFSASVIIDTKPSPTNINITFAHSRGAGSWCEVQHHH